MAVSKSQVLAGALGAAAVAVVAIAGGGIHPPMLGQDGSGQLIKAATEPVLAAAPGAPMSFADIFEKVAPAVVSIKVTSKVDINALRRGQGLEGFPFGLVPRGLAPEEGDTDPRRAPKQQSSGSGFFISADGYIVTNNHVIENAEDIKVVLRNGQELKGTLVGRDEGTDLAVIRVEGHDYPFVSFENKARPRVGDWVLAVGNPYDLGGTATAGIVSAYKRDIGERFVDYIQIDAPINRGNSGGPTFDTYGRVIGVNTAIFSPSGGSVGIGFDIPADIAESVTKQLMAGHKITRGYIGATIQDLNSEMASSWGLTGRKGAVVAGLVPGGPAARGGIEPGDVVVSVNGQAVGSASELTREVAKVHAGDVLTLEVYRDGKQKSVEIHSGLRPSEQQLTLNGGAGAGDQESDGAQGGGPVPPRAGILGMSLAPIDPATRQRFSIGATIKGVLIQDVKGSSDAGDKGLRRGDVIVRAGDRAVENTADVVAAVGVWKKAGRTSIPLAVNRGGVTLFVPIKIDG